MSRAGHDHTHGLEDGDEQGASSDGLDRREVLRLAAASAAMLAMTACRRGPPEQAIVPYVDQPPEAHPGEPLSFATAMTVDGYGLGLLAESHDGRPTKVRGNPDHPASLGATNAIAEASVLSVYDPDRASTVQRRGQIQTWAAARQVLTGGRDPKGRGLHLLLEPTSSPTVIAALGRLREALPQADVRFHSALAPRNAWRGSAVALGKPYETRLDLTRAEVVVALDADFVVEGPAALRHARQFAHRRKPASPAEPMSRLYVVEPAPTPTGVVADHRLALPPSEVLAAGAALARELAAGGAPVPPDVLAALEPWAARVASHEAWLKTAARDLGAHRGASVIVVGESAPAELHALAHGLNAALGNVGSTVTYGDSPVAGAGSDAFDLGPLARALEAGAVETLVILGGNPAYDTPRDLGLAARFGKSKASVYLGLYANETAEACEWLIPQLHWLEAWGDTRAYDGTTSLVQPLLAPLGDARSVAEVLAAMNGAPPATPHDLLVAQWSGARGRDLDRWLERGVVPGTAFAPAAPAAPKWSAIAAAIAALPTARARQTLELALRPDPRVRDGALANNPWLQEMPASLTTIVWDNAALLSSATAERLGVTDGAVLHLERRGSVVLAPVQQVPGHADETITLLLGGGRRGAEAVARGVGTNAYLLQTSDSSWFAADLLATATGDSVKLARYQEIGSLEGRDDRIAMHRTVAEWRGDPQFASEQDKRKLTLYEDTPTPGPGHGQQWGMTVDLAACTGCGACTIACQAENNVPSVGKAGMAKGRGMHWIRIDRYWLGGPGEAQAVLQPMLCQHCEKAPCEYVCPVNATTHSADGLNQMVYNRCVGTRFCSNNCPYKVRRFNWFNYHEDDRPGVARVYNPDVTVRARGVIEKCTFCVQRIREAQIRTRREGVLMKDGDVATACEEACASRAIVFGDLSDPTSRVSRARKAERVFACLDDLGTEPRVRYLARIKNPNPNLPRSA
jgi:Fe-S-cluster-containing dehydrogenase component